MMATMASLAPLASWWCPWQRICGRRPVPCPGAYFPGARGDGGQGVIVPVLSTTTTTTSPLPQPSWESTGGRPWTLPPATAAVTTARMAGDQADHARGHHPAAKALVNGTRAQRAVHHRGGPPL